MVYLHLLFEINVLPGEGADLADPKPHVVSDLDGQQGRILFLFQIVRQRRVLLKGDRGDGQPVLAVSTPQLVTFLLLPDLF